MPGVLATIAQQGQSGAGGGFTPPDETIATSASGNYNMAMLVHPTGNVHPNHSVWANGKIDGSEFSQTGARESTAEVNWSTGNFQLFNGGSYGSIQIYNGGYARHSQTGDSYTWTIQNIASSLSNGVTITDAVNTYKTVQDCTGINDSASSQGITQGDQIRFAMGGGRGGLTYPAAGDTMEWEVKLEVDDQEFYFVCKVEVTWVT